MKNWSIFAMGGLCGASILAVVLTTFGSHETHAVMQTADRAGDMIVASGGTQAQINNVIWVVKKGEDYTHLAVYRIEPNEKEMKLLAARNISFDLQIENHLNNKSPLPSEVKKGLDDARKEGQKPPK